LKLFFGGFVCRDVLASARLVRRFFRRLFEVRKRFLERWNIISTSRFEFLRHIADHYTTGHHRFGGFNRESVGLHFQNSYQVMGENFNSSAQFTVSTFSDSQILDGISTTTEKLKPQPKHFVGRVMLPSPFWMVLLESNSRLSHFGQITLTV
jgi:hypothetical protein